MGTFCPCVLFGQNVEQLNNVGCFGPCVLHTLLGGCIGFLTIWSLGPVGLWFTLVSCYACGIRTQIRRKYNLPEAPCGDCCVHFWCHPCAICQEHREMVSRPISSNLGFYASDGDVQMSAPPVVKISSAS
eukprot:SM000356S13440  [mRNA]  locus=s356:84599:85529:- [translate_table: standard]